MGTGLILSAPHAIVFVVAELCSASDVYKNHSKFTDSNADKCVDTSVLHSPAVQANFSLLPSGDSWNE